MDSNYYPPRARWYSRLFLSWFTFHRTLHLERINLPSGISVLQLLLGVVFPGYAFFTNGRRVLGWSFLGAYGLAGMVFLAALGYQMGSLGFALMVAAHASSIIFLQSYWLRNGSRFGFRMILALLTLIVVLGFYSQVLGFAGEHWIMPLQVNGKVVVVRRLASGQAVKRGDRVVYALSENRVGEAHRQGGAVWVRPGFGYGAVLAMPGDHLVFSTISFTVNGAVRQPLPHMPTSGELVVPEKSRFIWPELGISGNGNASEGMVSTLMLELAVVPEAQFIGQPFKRWFGRRQISS